MRAIPAMAHDAASLPYVPRVLGQLCPPGGAQQRLLAFDTYNLFLGSFKWPWQTCRGQERGSTAECGEVSRMLSAQ